MCLVSLCCWFVLLFTEVLQEIRRDITRKIGFAALKCCLLRHGFGGQGSGESEEQTRICSRYLDMAKQSDLTTDTNDKAREAMQRRCAAPKASGVDSAARPSCSLSNSHAQGLIHIVAELGWPIAYPKPGSSFTSTLYDWRSAGPLGLGNVLIRSTA